MDELTKMEEMVLIAVWKLRAKAYGYAIRKYIDAHFKKEISLGNLYSVLYQVHKKGYIHKSIGESTEKRRGKQIIYYAILPSGIEALQEARETHERVWDAVPEKAFLAKVK